MSIVSAFVENVRQFGLKKEKCIIGVSGGMDSMVLADLCHRHDLQFIIVHVNYNLRANDSILDRDLVIDWCKEKNIPLFIKEVNGKQEIGNNNLQDYARQVRYDYFEEIRLKEKAAYILTAHHLQDHVETILMHLFKGTGTRGMSGIPIRRNHILRPLLYIAKSSLEEYAQQHAIPYRNDSSNKENIYRRNEIRNNILPLIKEAFPEAEKNIVRTSHRISSYKSLADIPISKFLKKITKGILGTVPFSVHAQSLIAHTHADLLVYELLQHYGFPSSQIDELYKLTIARQGAYLENESHRIVMDKGWLQFVNKSTDEYWVINDMESLDSLYSSTIDIKKIINNPPINTNPKEILIDIEKITFPIIIRKWKAGDYFYPQGLNKKKKIAKFLIDEKVPIAERGDKLVILSGQYIVGVVGFRADHRCRVTDTTKEVLSFSPR